ncbi:squalene/phytoene synthase family protein [Gymnodinialimonas hymeniacidonis]|uniref:squalene/phytoene synthase family protein n=1 Tax=Gymnodinialimonas hymeniacidonis TaxID=3126508 RepID=UPI0034C6AE7F
MSVQACADLVARGDPRRFRAAMAAPLAAREVLLPLYAFNIEVSRAPWLTEEPMIAEMRLQWWRDALEEVAEGRGRRHEVVDALGFLDAEGAGRLDQLVAARRWDIYKDAFEDEAHFLEYIERTGAGLIEVGVSALGGTITDAVRAVGYASGLARYLIAVPELEARGRLPLVDGRPEAIAALATDALAALPRHMPKLAQNASAALFEAVQARAILTRASRDPMAVAEGRLEGSPLAERWALIRATMTDRL